MNELKPCPFCGAEPGTGYRSVKLQEIQRTTTCYGIRVDPYMQYKVKCRNCGAEAGSGISGYNGILKKTITEAEARTTAIDKWNRRPPLQERQ